jgi:PAS domain S-box-containing protein
MQEAQNQGTHTIWNDSFDILLIEDEDPHAELIQRAFEDRGERVRVYRTRSLSEAHSYLASNIPNLIIADWQLPDGEGLALLPDHNDPLATPVILMTSYGNERIAVEALKSGALDYVVKSPESMMDMPHLAARAIEQWNVRAERIRMQQALKVSESQFRLLAENASDMISRHTTQGIFIYVSPACKTIIGFSPDELIGKSSLDFIHPEDLPNLRNLLLKDPSVPRGYTFAYRARHKNEQYVWLETSARSILDEKTDTIIEIQAASRDITERKLAESTLQSAHQSLQEAYERTIEGWVHALDLRDKETEGHTQRVTRLTVKVARILGLSEEELVHIQRGALLHDMGKMAIKDDILQKPGPLTDAEWIEMRKHPIYTHEMLSPITYLQPALDIPYCHHERWDGSGYPRGLKREEIPLVARLFSIIDVWDALSSDRPYRNRSPHPEVATYLRKEAGRLFDPRLVELFLSIVNE